MCGQQRCQCNVIFKPYLLCVKGVAYQSPSPTKPSDNLPIHFIEVTYYNDGLLDESIIIEIENDYEPSIDNIIKRGWHIH